MGWIKGLSGAVTPAAQMATQIFQGRAESSSYDVSAAAMDAEAAYQRARGSFISTRTRKQGTRFMGRQRAAMASQGIDPNTGSALDVLADTAAEVELDALLAEHESGVNANRARTRAGIYRSSAAMAERSGTASAVGTLPKLLTGISKWSWKNKKPDTQNWPAEIP